MLFQTLQNNIKSLPHWHLSRSSLFSLMESLNSLFLSSSESFHLPSHLLSPPLENNPLSDEDITSQMCQQLPNIEVQSLDTLQFDSQGVNEDIVTLCRKERLLKVEALKKTCRLYCCGRNSLRKLGYNKIKQEREIFLGLKRSNQNSFLRASLGIFQEQTRYTILDEIVCRRCFLKVTCLQWCHDIKSFYQLTKSTQ